MFRCRSIRRLAWASSNWRLRRMVPFSVQLADDAVDAGELQPELARVDMVGERSPVGAELQLLNDVQVTVLHNITDGRRVTGDGDIDRAGRVAERAGVMVRPVRPHDPLARPYRLVAFVHRIDQDEVATVALAADAVDDELGSAMKDDLEDI